MAMVPYIKKNLTVLLTTGLFFFEKGCKPIDKLDKIAYLKVKG